MRHPKSRAIPSAPVAGVLSWDNRPRSIMTHRYTHRTLSARKRAGSRDNKKRHNVPTFASDTRRETTPLERLRMMPAAPHVWMPPTPSKRTLMQRVLDKWRYDQAMQQALKESEVVNG